ncbi:KAP-like P-loop domain-containing protein [Isoptericola sp. CG 20/1183]|uniref:KAP-like P-loop domain-containing protein n=1 Tax=Isoptericola halotolerans TaxID=300560 RepID=A0ABX5EKZ9_9MICO|nr:KAP-like P-loop domain-containing protein [Isoptericola halotolerans]PRZ10727.1 KAP-like P-loop domain-containing protein [Isoptericola sp. CG 20/1183]
MATFNPWTYPDPATLQRGFFNELGAELPDEDRLGNARAKVGDFARAISPLGGLASVIGLQLENPLKAVGDLIAGDTSASAAKRAAEVALRRSGRPVLMVVDDLDRLTPDELLEVLKLVRLVGRLPHVYYLLSYDERTLLDVLRRTSVTGDDETRARAYMEKIVQVRLDMPTLRYAQRSALLEAGIEQVGSQVDLQLSEDDERRLGEIYFSVLDRRLATPRAVNRFLGQVQAFYPLLHGEVDFVDFFLVTWLRTQEPGVYRMLQSHRDELLRVGVASFTVNQNASAQQERREKWHERLATAHVKNVDVVGVVKVLSTLFPELEAAFSNFQQFAQAGQRATPKAISDPDYFDRYVSFGVPMEDVSDSDVLDALDDLARGEQGPASRRLAEEVAGNAARIMRKLDALRQSGRALPERSLFELITRNASSIDRRRTSMFDDPWRSAVFGGASCLGAMGSESAAETVGLLAAEPDLEEYVVEAVWFLLRSGSDPDRSRVSNDYDLDAVARAAAAALKASRGTQPPENPLDEGALTSFWTWRALDTKEADAWFRQQVDSGRWSLVDALGALTTTAVSIGAGTPETSISEFDIQAADEIFGLEAIYSDASADIDAATPPGGGTFRVPATRDNRIRHSLLALKQSREQPSPQPPQKE